MTEPRKLMVSHAPFWHCGNRITARSYHTILAALPAVLAGIYYYGLPALRVVTLAVSSAILWELGFNRAARRPNTVGDGNVILIGLLFAMLVPATMPWWAIITGTFLAVVIGKHIYGGIGSNAFNPVAVAIGIMMVSWGHLFNFDATLANYEFEFTAVYPLAAVKYFGSDAVSSIQIGDLLLGRQLGGIGSTFGIGLLAGGIYLVWRGFIRWEIALSFLATVYFTALLYHLVAPSYYAAPAFHLLTGYTLIGALFLATEDSSSPVNFYPMLIYGAVGGVMTVLIRNTGQYVDGVILSILLINLINPLLDKIRPKALGKVT